MTSMTRVLMIFLAFSVLSTPAFAIRIKDLAQIRGVRENQLIGYGLVIGLNGTGDGKTEFTSKSFARMLDNLGLKLDSKDIESKNVAAVLVTASLPPFARAGAKIDVTINSIGNASSLSGGTLVQTPLRAADQQVYAVAQGAILTGSTGGGGNGQGGEKPHLTVAHLPDGAVIEQDLISDFSNKKVFRLILNNPDFTTASRLVRVVNEDLGGKYASAKDSSTVDIIVPFNYEGNAVELMAAIENLQVMADGKAKVVVNEKTGTVVIGENVTISTVAISHGSLTLQVNGPDDGSGIRGPASATPGKPKGDKIAVLKRGANIGELVKALNALGVSPKDLITILQNIKAAGALQGELEVL